ncbi:class I SAM-dependent methyltransferase [Paenibacillus apiarius]|uniref:Class I SAM-dependent methyltransferase n=1 Tax=Paenibacillus apiarius TaxID=46240 RepID=A0ABT4DTY3_9BACL|nr:class I SAM-dependent methyltransferase [Paenibacillus apiarius]MCY9514122.1 class I SAM-dependent methyltransferase [Paenibacillus apiarius]MCY9520245.1 class I SAM-dependent methyltransferase [Paenibacillus apiarius]MCY9550413.1 class I SAM-dependent methyltransferase [Paenibacillus apiarius]MCY9557475.1 class I SAM-dependent methyltransferase [Paenibacillus apiarius]MCY9682346.1 class I SAM-dependent methyltransferase [Paenibacillus apiarius]
MNKIKSLFKLIVGNDIEYKVRKCDLCDSKSQKVFKVKPSEEWAPVKNYYRDKGLLNDDFLKIPDTFTLVKCANCGLVYTSPRLKDSIVNRFYNEYLGGKYKEYIHEYDSEFREQVFKEYMEIIESNSGFDTGNILDIGCAKGSLLKVAKERGWKTYGIEVSALAGGDAEQHGVILIGDVLEQLERFEKENFDVVSMIDTLEHLKSPRATLQKIYSVMKNGGLVYIEVPNVEAGLDEMSRHFYLFSFETMEKMLSSIGFNKVEQIESKINQYNPIDVGDDRRFLRVVARK